MNYKLFITVNKIIMFLVIDVRVIYCPRVKMNRYKIDSKNCEIVFRFHNITKPIESGPKWTFHEDGSGRSCEIVKPYGHLHYNSRSC